MFQMWSVALRVAACLKHSVLALTKECVGEQQSDVTLTQGCKCTVCSMRLFFVRHETNLGGRYARSNDITINM